MGNARGKQRSHQRDASEEAVAKVPETEELPEEEGTPDEEPDVGGISMEVLQRMIEQLPEGYRIVFNLYVFEQKSHKEIAALLGIKENSSASQFLRAKRMLARQIQQYQQQQL